MVCITGDYDIHTLIINLKSQIQRMEFMLTQMAHHGLVFERIEAITPATLEHPTNAPYWFRWQRPLRDTEKALLESHRIAWNRIIQLNVPCLVLEDDALLSEDVATFLQQVEKMVNIDHLTLEERGRKKLLGPRLDSKSIRRLYQDRTGAAAYVLWPSGARVLLAHTTTVGQLADGAICSAYKLRSYQASPALAIQVDRCTTHNIPQPISVNSTIDAQKKPQDRSRFTASQRLGFRLRRIYAQFRMGVRQLTYLGRARYEEVKIASDWPEFTIELENSPNHQ